MVALASLSLLIGCGAPDEGPTPGLPAPEITALDLNNQPVRLADYRGRIVLLDFWTGGCGPCLIDLSQMEGIYQQYRDAGLTVLAVNRGEAPEYVAELTRRLMPLSYPVAIDQRGLSAKRYGVMAVPTSFVLDRQGMVREKVLGEISRDRLEAMLIPLLGVEPAAPDAEPDEAEAQPPNRSSDQPQASTWARSDPSIFGPTA